MLAPPRQGTCGGEGASALHLEVRRQARTVQPRRPPARCRPEPRHRHEAVSRDAFEAARDDYPRYHGRPRDARAADRLVGEEGRPSVRHHLLLVGALVRWVRATGDERADPRLVPAAGLRHRRVRAVARRVRAVRVHGAARKFFNPSTGGMVCLTCRPSGSARVDISTAAHLGALPVEGDWDGRLQVVTGSQKTASGLVSAFAAWHIERGLRAWPMWSVSKDPTGRQVAGWLRLAGGAAHRPRPRRRPGRHPARSRLPAQVSVIRTGSRGSGCDALSYVVDVTYDPAPPS